MFSITTKTRYGVAAVVELAKNYGNGLVKIKDIVERHDIPKNYLEQIFNRLQKQGLIRSTRGNRGGYELFLAPEEVSLLSVIESLDGELQLTDGSLPKSVASLLHEVVDQAKKTLDVSLAEIVTRQQAHDELLMFHI